MATLLKQPGCKNWYVVFRKALEKPVGRRTTRVVWLATGTPDEEKAKQLLATVQALQDERSRRDAVAKAVAMIGGPGAAPARRRLVDLPGFYRAVAELPAEDEAMSPQERTRMQMLGTFLAWMNRRHPEAEYLQEVSPGMAAEFWRWMAEDGKSPRTRNNYLSQINVVWKTVGAEAGLSDNPWTMIRRDQGGGERYGDLSAEQVGRLLWEADRFEDSRLDKGFWSGAIRLAVFTGLREGDVATLEASEIRRDGGALVLRPNKTHRWGPGAQVVHSLDAPWLAHVPAPAAGGPVWPLAAAAYGSGRCHWFGEEWKALCGRAGIQVERPPAAGERRKRAVKLATFHSLRHTFVTLAVRAGAARDDIRRLAGHSSAAMTDHYDHSPALEAARRVAAAMPEIEPIPAREEAQ
jgi:integrase